MKNIHKPVEVYAITNSGVTVPEYEWKKPRPQGKTTNRKGNKNRTLGIKQQPVSGGKSKWTAGLLAFFFGPLGVHRFYLGQRKLGILFLPLFVLFIFVLPGIAEFIAVLGFVAFIDFIIFFTMP
ncbi:MAG: TM2 domain-containing protein, partial [Verrucomicrobiota bacterium]